jgi:hypothetical protein
MQSHSFSKRQLAATALMFDEEEKNASLSDKKKRTWVHKCFRTSNLSTVSALQGNVILLKNIY